MKYEVIIGLEVHMQLKTKSKMFCSCAIPQYNAEPNTYICPICMGHPGTLPVPNEEAIKLCVKAAKALGAKIPAISKFDRKHYFYPDLAKGYQISQYDKPIGVGGAVKIGKKKIHMTRIHLEEDVGKNFHVKESAGQSAATLVDFNRSGIPLMEMVSEPDIKTPEEAKEFLVELRAIMRSAEISDADMEKGQMRCDANISLRRPEEKKLYPKTELKNINSFRFVERALQFEIQRLTELWEKDAPPAISSTRGWDESTLSTKEQRVKEAQHDYRYFPEPDIPPFRPKKIAKSIELPELPPQKRERFERELFFTEKDAKILSEDPSWAAFSENTMSELYEWVRTNRGIAETAIFEDNTAKELGKLAGNWLTNKLREVLSGEKIDIKITKITPENFAELIKLFYEKKINSTNAQKVLIEMALSGADPNHIMEEKKLGLFADKNALRKKIAMLIESNPKEAAEFKTGKHALIAFFMGKLMKETEGTADPVLSKELLTEELNK